MSASLTASAIMGTVLLTTGGALAGYDVAYRLNGNSHHVRMDQDPGARVPLTDGRVIVASARSPWEAP
jgi:uncharacterized protein YcfJ